MPIATQITAQKTRSIASNRHDNRARASDDAVGLLFRGAYALCGSKIASERLVEQAHARLSGRRSWLRGHDKAALFQMVRASWIADGCPSTNDSGCLAADVEFAVNGSYPPFDGCAEIRAVYRALHRLPAREREAVAAVDVVGLSPRQAASALRIRRSEVELRVLRGREAIARELADPQHDLEQPYLHAS